MIMPHHMLGDQPIEAEYEKKMNDLMRLLDKGFNGTKRGNDRTVGLVLLVFNYGEKEGRCNYISNGADRKDMVKLLREQAQRFEDQDDCNKT
jgi:hypothetical protein